MVTLPRAPMNLLGVSCDGSLVKGVAIMWLVSFMVVDSGGSGCWLTKFKGGYRLGAIAERESGRDVSNKFEV